VEASAASGAPDFGQHRASRRATDPIAQHQRIARRDEQLGRIDPPHRERQSHGPNQLDRPVLGRNALGDHLERLEAFDRNLDLTVGERDRGGYCERRHPRGELLRAFGDLEQLAWVDQSER
jgi:hypothetical protein